MISGEEVYHQDNFLIFSHIIFPFRHHTRRPHAHFQALIYGIFCLAFAMLSGEESLCSDHLPWTTPIVPVASNNIPQAQGVYPTLSQENKDRSLLITIQPSRGVVQRL